MALWRRKDLVHDAEMWMRLDDAVPPVPAGAMDGALGEGAEGLEIFPVGEDDDGGFGFGGCAGETGRSA